MQWNNKPVLIGDCLALEIYLILLADTTFAVCLRYQLMSYFQAPEHLVQSEDGNYRNQGPTLSDSMAVWKSFSKSIQEESRKAKSSAY